MPTIGFAICSTKRHLITMYERIGKFALGHVVYHRGNEYFGVVYDVDPMFLLPQKEDDQTRLSDWEKDQPWYRLLVDGDNKTTYVAESNLVACSEPNKIDHPALSVLFDGFDDGRYISRVSLN